MDTRIDKYHTARLAEVNKDAYKWGIFAILALAYASLVDASFIEALPAIAVLGMGYYAVFF